MQGLQERMKIFMEAKIEIESAYESNEIQAFTIDTPERAEWAIKKIKEARKRRDLFTQAAQHEIAELEAQIKSDDESCKKETSYLLFLLDRYLDTVPAKRTETKMSLKLPAGRIVRKFAKQSLNPDDEALLQYLKSHAPEYVKLTCAPAWGEFKANLQINSGVVVRKDTGEVIDCVKIEEIPASFEVE